MVGQAIHVSSESLPVYVMARSPGVRIRVRYVADEFSAKSGCAGRDGYTARELLRIVAGGRSTIWWADVMKIAAGQRES